MSLHGATSPAPGRPERPARPPYEAPLRPEDEDPAIRRCSARPARCAPCSLVLTQHVLQQRDDDVVPQTMLLAKCTHAVLGGIVLRRTRDAGRSVSRCREDAAGPVPTTRGGRLRDVISNPPVRTPYTSIGTRGKDADAPGEGAGAGAQVGCRREGPRPLSDSVARPRPANT